MIDTNFWGEPISVYTDADALEDGILIDVADLNIEFNGRLINRVTCGAEAVLKLREKQTATAKNNLQFISDNCTFDGEGADAWGIFQPHARLCNEKFWLVPNEVSGYTLLLPEEY